MIHQHYRTMMPQLPVYEVEGEFERKDIDTIVVGLLTNSALLFEEDKERENRLFGGCPVRQSYLLLIHPDLVEDMTKVGGFLSSKNYPLRTGHIPNEIGCIGNLRIIGDSGLSDLVEGDTYISIAGGFGENDTNPEHYIVVKSR
jgi:hypothetical protein